jgi:hypothetical protein
MLLDVDAKIGRKDIFTTTIRNVNLHEISNDNVVGVEKLGHNKKSDCQKYNVQASYHFQICLDIS